MTYTLTSYPTREEWLEARTESVQSSEVAALFSDPKNPFRGLSSWDSPISISFVKRGYLPATKQLDQHQADDLEWRRQQEPLIARWWVEKIQRDLPAQEGMTKATRRMLQEAPMEDPGHYTIARPTDGFPWGATVDRVLLHRDQVVAVVELKTAHPFMAQHWTSEPPLPYQLQVQLQMAVLGVEHGFLVASIGGGAPVWAYRRADREMQAILRAKVEEFWADVEADRDPVADGSQATSASILQRWPHESGEVVELDDAAAEMWERRQRIHEAIKLLDLKKKTYDNRLKQAIASATYGRMPNGRVLQLKATKRGNRLLRESNDLMEDEIQVA